MKTYWCTAALLLLAVSQSRAELIINGSFESFSTSGAPYDQNFGSYIRFFGPPATSSNTEITGWTITGQSGGHPNSVDLANSSLWPAYVGSESLDMEGAVGAAGVIEQSFATTLGTEYVLSFAYGNNPGGNGATLNVLVTGIGTLLNTNVSHNTSTFVNMDYRLFSAEFVADSSTTTLLFSEVTNSGFGIVLDAVSGDAAVPEPISIALFGLGVACLIGHGLWGKRNLASGKL